MASSIQELMDALRSRKTNITRALDDLFGTAQTLAALRSHPHRADLTTPNVFGVNAGDPLPSGVVDELKSTQQRVDDAG